MNAHDNVSKNMRVYAGPCTGGVPKKHRLRRLRRPVIFGGLFLASSNVTVYGDLTVQAEKLKITHKPTKQYLCVSTSLYISSGCAATVDNARMCGLPAQSKLQKTGTWCANSCSQKFL